MMAGRFREIPGKGGIQIGPGSRQAPRGKGRPTSGRGTTQVKAQKQRTEHGCSVEKWAHQRTRSSCREESLQSLVEGLEPGPAGRGIIRSCQQG